MQVIDAASDKQEQSLTDFGNFIEADSIIYLDHGSSEDFIINKGGKSFIIGIRGNKVDGAFAIFLQKENK